MATRRWRVLVSAPYLIPVLPQYEPLFTAQGIEIVIPSPLVERLEEEALLSWVRDVDGVICGDDRFTERVFQAAPRLKVISKWGTGVDSIDRAAARRRGIAIYNTPAAFSGPVADSVMAYVLAFARRTVLLDRQMHAGGWEKQPGVALRECVLGVIGVGNIGKAVVTRATAFGMTVLGNDPVEVPAPFRAATRLAMVSKEELLERADFVSLNCDLNPTSFHLIGAQELRRMKRSAYLINTARGPIVDEVALIQALQARTIAGAALDVFELEPLPVESPLRQLDNCLLAPHNANASPAAARLVHENTIRNLIAGLQTTHGTPHAVPSHLLHT